MKNNQSGFTLFVALVVAGVLAIIVSGVINISSRQSVISNSGLESQLAFYAADSGMECALFWDVKNPSGSESAFATTTVQLISCNKNGANPANEWTVGGNSTTTIAAITFLPEPYCSKVVVVKKANGTTLIESFGYNTCDAASAKRVERAVRATY